MDPHRWIGALLLPVALLAACEGEVDEAGSGIERGTQQPPERPDDVRMERRTAEYAEWDRDNDEQLGVEEFRSWWTEEDRFAGWDTDGDGEVSPDELSRRLFANWDQSDDDVISEVEWREGVDRWFAGDVEAGTWEEWDADDDSDLDRQEFATAIEERRLYERIDRDRDDAVGTDDLADWFFDLFDRDDDDRIEAPDWERATSELLDR